MSSKKDSVVFFKDWKPLISCLPLEDQVYFWGLFMDFDPDNLPICENASVLPIWSFIKSQLMKMDKNYQNTVVLRNKTNGAKGGRPKNQVVTETQDNPNNPVGLNETQITLKRREDKIREDKVVEDKIDFIDFWELYDKKTGKPICENKWDKLPRSTQEDIMAYIPKYKAAQSDKQYRKNPEVFLNRQSWKDEIILKSNPQTNQVKQDKKYNFL